MSLYYFKKHFFGLLGIAFVLFILIYGGIDVINRKKQLNQFPRYAIGTTYDTWKPLRSGRRVLYEFSVLGQRYEGSGNMRDYIEVPKRYYVKFSEKNPKHNKMLFDKPVPDHIKEAPPEGWKRISE